MHTYVLMYVCRRVRSIFDNWDAPAELEAGVTALGLNFRNHAATVLKVHKQPQLYSNIYTCTKYIRNLR